ncbi:AraC family transcriptional regulator [Schaedlerella arabinosiphila]|nr:AraC family transcriptional regulator [Schaedlerella arabinosiphila]
MSVSAIAEKLGYMDSGNFRHIFKKYYGVAPAEYLARCFSRLNSLRYRN